MASSHEPQTASRPSVSDPSDAAAWRPKSALVGTVLANRYRIVAPLGTGSTGAVFQADDIQLGKSVVVRVLVPALAHEPGLVQRIRARIERNAEISKRDPQTLINLVDITDIGMTLEAEVFVVTDYMDGDHLTTMLTRGGRLPWNRARSLLIRLSQIVHGLHQDGIIVGALEARRCYAIRGKNKHETIKVLSTPIFEHLAGAIGPHASHAAAVLARYVSPEQACGEPIDPRSDVYSLGVIAYELLTGNLPFTDANPVRLVAMHLQRMPRPPREAAPDAGIPADVEAALLRSLAKAPDDRFQSMEAFGSALLAIAESVSSTGAHNIVPASLAASEIPAMRVDAATTPGVAAATLAVTNRTSPPAEPTTGSPGVAAATLAVTNETSPPVEPAAEIIARTEAAVAADAAPDPTTMSPTAGRYPAIQTHVTLRPGSLSSDAITANTNMQSGSRPATLPPTLGSALRLPPPPSLGRPATIPPRPTLGAPSATTHAPSGAVPRPPTLGMATLPRPASGPFAAASAAQVAAAASAASASTASTSPTTPAEVAAAQTLVAEAPVKPALADGAAQPVLTDSKPVLADSATQPVLADSSARTADPEGAATSGVRAAMTALEAVRSDEPRAASSTSSARRPVIRLTEVRKSEGDSASSSGAYLRVMAEDAAKPVAATQPEADKTDKPEKPADAALAAAAMPAYTPPVTPTLTPAPTRPAVSDEVLRTAALQKSQSGQKQATASLSQVAGTTDSLVAEVPRSRAGLWIGGAVALAAAAGLAIVMSSPGFNTPATPTAPTATRPTAPGKLADKPPTPTPPERGTGVVAPDPTPDTARPEPDTAPTTVTAGENGDPDANAPVATLVAPTDPENTEPAGKKDKKDTKKKKRVREETPEEEPEKDVFDQLREHMAKKKAAEDAYKASLQKPATPTPATTPTPAPSENLSEADKAKETLDRAKQAASTGNPQLAYTLAKQSYGVTKSQEALELMGVSACRLKNAENARSAANSLTGSRRDAVVAACTKTGITL